MGIAGVGYQKAGVLALHLPTVTMLVSLPSISFIRVDTTVRLFGGVCSFGSSSKSTKERVHYPLDLFHLHHHPQTISVLIQRDSAFNLLCTCCSASTVSKPRRESSYFSHGRASWRHRYHYWAGRSLNWCSIWICGYFVWASRWMWLHKHPRWWFTGLNQALQATSSDSKLELIFFQCPHSSHWPCSLSFNWSSGCHPFIDWPSQISPHLWRPCRRWWGYGAWACC